MVFRKDACKAVAYPGICESIVSEIRHSGAYCPNVTCSQNIDIPVRLLRRPFVVPYRSSFVSVTVVMQQPAILSRLRTETRSQHDAIEQTLRLVDDKLTRQAYRHRLAQFYGFYKPVEDRIYADLGPLSARLVLAKRRKAHLLEADLTVLCDRDVMHLPLCHDLPRLTSVAECFGCMYVLEGATLGGILISRHIQMTLGITPATGGRFFSGYAEQTGAMWQEFRAAITGFALTSEDQDTVIKTACTTFEALRSWCEGSIRQ